MSFADNTSLLTYDTFKRLVLEGEAGGPGLSVPCHQMCRTREKELHWQEVSKTLRVGAAGVQKRRRVEEEENDEEAVRQGHVIRTRPHGFEEPLIEPALLTVEECIRRQANG